MQSKKSACSATLRKTAKPAETCEPDKDTGVIAESSAQEEVQDGQQEVAENGEQQETENYEQHEGANGEQQEDTVVLGENNEKKQE